MALDSYTFNTSTKKFVLSYDEPTPIDPLEWGHGDNRPFTVTFVRNISSTRVERILDVVSARITLSKADLTQLTQTTSTTSSNYAFSFVLPIASAAITTLMTGVTARQSTICEFLITDSEGTARYGAVAPIYIRPKQSADTDPDTAINDVALGLNQASGIFVPRIWPAGMVQEVVTASGRRFINYPGDDGLWHLDPI